MAQWHPNDGLTFDDVLLVPRYSDVLPRDCDVRTQLSRGIMLNLPLVASPMDTVTESVMAIGLARLGGIGIIHRNLPVDRQAAEVRQVKVSPAEEPSADLESIAASRQPPLKSVKCSDGAATGGAGISGPGVDASGRLLVGAAIGVHDLDRAAALVAAEADVIVIDTAHGHSANVIETLRAIRRQHPHIQIIAGNIATAEGAKALIDAGADGLRVGFGPGSICTTRIVAGVGVPQITAIMDAVNVAETAGIPVIADGGIRLSGDITKALAAGARTVMLGSLLAGVDESPGTIVEEQGRRYKVYRGMGSAAAMAAGSADRYGQGAARGKWVPEGVEGRVPWRGKLAEMVYQLVGGLRSGMGYCGARDLAALRDHARFLRITAAGVVESHPHDITMPRTD